MKEVIVITGASSGFGALTARALAEAGHTVYATMTGIHGKNAAKVEELAQFARQHHVDIQALELDVTSQESSDAAIAAIIKEQGRLDVVIHNAGHMDFGPAEAFTPEQYADLYDINVLGTQRVNRSALPHLRQQGRGLLIWVSSTSARSGGTPYLAPYFAAKAGMDSLAVSYASELIRWGIETTIIVPGSFTKGTEHFANAGKPADQERVAAYEAGPYAGFGDIVLKGTAAASPADADAGEVATAMVQIVAAPSGQRPFRVYVDPTQDGAEVVGVVADRIHAEFMRRVGLADCLPAVLQQPH